MDRADLGRRLLAPTQIAVGVTRESPLLPLVEGVAEELDYVPRVSQPARSKGTSRPALERVTDETLERVRKTQVAALLLEAELLIDKKADEALWMRTYKLLRDAERALPNGQVLVASLSPEDQPKWERSLAVARLKNSWKALAKDFSLDELAWPESVDPFWDEHIRSGHGLERLAFVFPQGEGELKERLKEALETPNQSLVHYKDSGSTYTLPPLHHWLSAGAYALFGASETSARLPAALMAFLALLALVLAARSLFGARVATLAGFILMTSPTFFAQGRSVAGEAGAILGLTLVTIALLRHGKGERGTSLWLSLLTGLFVGFLAKGLVAPLSYVAIAGLVSLVAMPKRRSDWAPFVLLGALFTLLTLWVELSPATGFAGQFRFTLPLFSEGPTDYERNFDYAMKAIGFGLFPWTPLVVIAMAWMVRIAVREESVSALVLISAFVVPTMVSMGFLKDFNHLLWPAAPVVALALALMLERIDELRAETGTVMAFLLLIMGFILARELGKSAEPLAGMLTYDPPFSDEGKTRFPAELSVKTWARVALFLVIIPFVLHLSRVVGTFVPVVTFLRREMATRLALAFFVVLLPLTWLIRALSAFVVGMDTTSASQLSAAQRTWHLGLLQGGDPLALIALGTLVLVVLTWLVRYGVLGRRFSERGALPSEWLSDKVALVTAAFAFVLLALHMLWVVWPEGSSAWPEGYWGEVLMSSEFLFVALISIAGFVRFRRHDRLMALSVFFAFIGLWLGTRLVRDVFYFPPVAIGASVAGGLAWAVYILPRLWWRARQGIVLGSFLVALALLLWVLPLLDRWDVLSAFIYEGDKESLLLYLLFSSRLSWLAYGAIALILINQRFPRLLDRAIEALGGLFERGPIVRVLALIGAIVFSVGLLADFYPSLAKHLSQKHVLESYERAAGAASGTLYKHGRFDDSKRQDSNFYTAGLPSLSDRSTALNVLLGERDQVASVESEEGSVQRLLPGFDSANDKDGDGKRDHAVLRGIATEISPGRLVDTRASWTPDEHVGKVLVGVKGKSYRIEGNDATTLTLGTRAKPMLKVRVNDPDHYMIDHADSAESRASAYEKARRFLLLPSDSLSEVNHAFRKLSGGRHLPVLDGRSSRVMLASSWLEEGEEEQNRFAQHTLDMERFEALDDPKIHRLWVNFNDSLRIVGYRLNNESVSVGKKIELTIYFQVTKKVKASQKIFLHIDRQGTSNRIHGDHWPLNQALGDEPQKTCVGCYRTDHWFVGDVVLDRFDKEVPTGTSAGIYEIWMGLYNTSTDKRMVVKRWDKDNVRHDGSNRVRLGTFRVR